MYQYLKDKKSFKKYKFLERKTDLTNPNYLPISLNRSRTDFGSSIPFLKFNHYIKTHMLTPSYYHNPLSRDKEILHAEIFKLYNKGLGYRQIHKRLIEKGIKVAKSPTTIDFIIKKRLKRNEFLNQLIIDIYRNFEIQFLKVFKE